MFDVYLNEFSTQVERIVLLYDNFDSYTNSPAACDYFKALETNCLNIDQSFVVVAASHGPGALTYKTGNRYPIFSYAEPEILVPFQEEDLRKLAGPFQERGTTLSPELLSTLCILSGGNLKLATYGLQSLWQTDKPSPHHLVEAFNHFRSNYHLISNIRKSTFGPQESEAQFHVWKKLKSTGKHLSQRELTSIMQRENPERSLDGKRALDLLRVGGFIRMDNSTHGVGPIVAEIIPSLFSFDDLEEQQLFTSLQEQLHAEIVDTLAEIHRWAPSYYRPGNKERGVNKLLVPESVFVVVLATRLGGRGWKVDLELMSGAGFADITARHPRFGEELAKVEVKIWPRKVGTIHDQITSYFTKGVTALATVVIGDLKDPAWKDEYEKQCLTGKTDGPSSWKELDLPLEGYFEARWKTRVVEHFLLRLPSRI